MERKLESILNQIQKKTNNEILVGTPIKELLVAYTKENWLKEDYHGGFWTNEGYEWKYSWDKDIVKLIDEFFILYRKTYYPNIGHVNYYEEYKTRSGYIKDNTEEIELD